MANHPNDIDQDLCIALAVRLLGAAQYLPQDDAITNQERQLVLDLEKEVDAAFGPDARLYGRAVALYAVRDLLRQGG